MRCSAILCSLALVAMFAGGCSTSRLAAYTQPEVTLHGTDNTVSLATLEPAPAQRTNNTQRSFQLGAGDALGQAIFANYAAIVRANAGWQYANVPTN